MCKPPLGAKLVRDQVQGKIDNGAYKAAIVRIYSNAANSKASPMPEEKGTHQT